MVYWRCGVAVITTTQLHATKSELRFCAGSNPASSVSEICNDEKLWQQPRQELSLSSVNHFTKAILHLHHHIPINFMKTV